jgi:hypothetical protein
MSRRQWLVSVSRSQAVASNCEGGTRSPYARWKAQGVPWRDEEGPQAHRRAQLARGKGAADKITEKLVKQGGCTVNSVKTNQLSTLPNPRAMCRTPARCGVGAALARALSAEAHKPIRGGAQVVPPQ